MLSINYTLFQRQTIPEVQQTEIEKLADSFKLTWFTLPDSFEIPRNPCQTVLIFFGFLFTPGRHTTNWLIYNQIMPKLLISDAIYAVKSSEKMSQIMHICSVKLYPENLDV